MAESTIGMLYGLGTLIVMFSGIPIAFALGTIAVLFMLVFMPAAATDTITQNVFEEMANITLLSIPLFILKGAAIGRSRAGSDLYLAINAWMHKIPGGLGIANVFACALFAAMAGIVGGERCDCSLRKRWQHRRVGYAIKKQVLKDVPKKNTLNEQNRNLACCFCTQYSKELYHTLSLMLKSRVCSERCVW